MYVVSALNKLGIMTYPPRTFATTSVIRPLLPMVVHQTRFLMSFFTYLSTSDINVHTSVASTEVPKARLSIPRTS